MLNSATFLMGTAIATGLSKVISDLRAFSSAANFFWRQIAESRLERSPKVIAASSARGIDF